jgi:hypothetical protein
MVPSERNATLSSAVTPEQHFPVQCCLHPAAQELLLLLY